MKKFSEVKVGDIGTDYCSSKVKILAKGIGRVFEVMQYDVNRAMADFFDNPKDYDYDGDLDTLEIVAVEFIDKNESKIFGQTTVHIYGSDGMTVDCDQKNQKEKMMTKDEHRKMLEEKFGLIGHLKAEKLYEIAYDLGHASGFYEVEMHYEDLSELLNSTK